MTSKILKGEVRSVAMQGSRGLIVEVGYIISAKLGETLKGAPI